MLSRFYFEPISSDKLPEFLDKKYSPSLDFPSCKEVFDNTVELAYDQEEVLATNVIHVCYDNLLLH